MGTLRQDASARDRAARREHRRLARVKLAELRAKLRDAVRQKKARMKEIAAECREQRLAVRTQIREMRQRSLREIHLAAQRAREEARVTCAERKRQLRAELDSAVAIARAELAAERERQAEERRIARTERARHAELKKAHATGAAHRNVRAPMLAALASLASRASAGPGESRPEAILRYGETHPEEVHALLHAPREGAIEATAAQIAQVERALDAPSDAELARADRSARRAARDEKPRGKPEAPRAATGRTFAEKRAARVDRMRTRADKLDAAARARFAAVDAITEAIPLGQPILVGHHSEKRHRRDIAKMRHATTAGLGLEKQAEQLRRRADVAETNRAISSDDPDAIPKLREKLRRIEENRAMWRAANEAIRAGGDVLGALRRLGMTDDVARDVLTKDPMGRIGFPRYVFQNAGSEAARIQHRIEQLEARAAAPAKPAEVIGDARVYEAENRVRIEFPSVPPEPLRRALKGSGFRWAPSVQAWQRHASGTAWDEARRILRRT